MFGQLIREKRKAHGLRLQDVADALGISVAYLSEVERGRRAPLGDAYLPKLAEVLQEDRERLRISARGEAFTLRAGNREQQLLIAALAERWDRFTWLDLNRLTEEIYKRDDAPR